MRSSDLVELTEKFAAHNYAPLGVVITRGEGVHVFDPEGNRYLDMLSGYSAINFGHCNPRLIAVAKAQLDRLTLTSRAFFSEEFALFSRDLATFCRKDKVLVMNSGAEAVETAIKAARRWGYTKKNIPANQAEIITFKGNFHGRTTTIVSFSSSSESRDGFGPFTPGFVEVPYGDLSAVESAISAATVGVLVEPIQGEGGVIIPPSGFLSQLRAVCEDRKILFIADEIQTGLCRTGAHFACDHEGVVPDIYILGKSLGGGIVPISAIAANDSIMEVFQPGNHGSTFGGNPFACAIAREVLRMIHDLAPERVATELGEYFVAGLKKISSPALGDIRGKGLLIGVDIRPDYGKAKKFCKKLLEKGVLCKDTHDQTIRFAPPLVITRAEIEAALPLIGDALFVDP